MKSSISADMYSTAIDQKKLNIYLEVINSVIIIFLDENHEFTVIRKESSDPATDIYMPIARNMADAQQVAYIISILHNMEGGQE